MKWSRCYCCWRLLPGCELGADFVGVAAAAGAGSASANPAVGIAVGIAARAGADRIEQYISRKRVQGEQDAIAEAAGSAPLGAPRAWEIRHTIPIGNEHGQLAAVREIRTPITTCREILFTVEDDGEIFTTTLCRGVARWKWAAAEPAVDRWGYLQRMQ